MTILGFVLIAALATVTRAVITAGQPAGEIPWRTFAVNIAGAGLLGILVASPWGQEPVVLGTAGLGSLTTFSTVVAESAALLDDGNKRSAIAYVVLTLVAGIAAASLGLNLGVLL